jgi:hypothetical protein
MKFTTSFSLRALVWRALAAGTAIVIMIGSAGAAQQGQSYPQGQAQGQAGAQQAQPQVPEAEKQAALKVQSALDITAQLQAAGEFVKQYPKSTARPQVANLVARKIADQPDAAQRITLAENFSTIFTEANEKDMITPVLLDAYLRTNRPDDAFRVFPAWLEKNPDDIGTLTQMALMGVDQVKRNNPKFAAQSQQYALKAIALIEAGKFPATMTPEQTNEYKTRFLPYLYQSLGLIGLISGNAAEAKTQLDKAVSLNATDPFNYLLLSSLVNDEYQALAKQHKETPDGPPKEAKLKQALAKMEQLVEIYAKVVAYSENNADYKQLHDQVKPELESYYKFLHNGSTNGLQELINKQKKQ